MSRRLSSWVASAFALALATSACDPPPPPEPEAPDGDALANSSARSTEVKTSPPLPSASNAPPATSNAKSAWPPNARRVSLDDGAMGTTITLATFTDDRFDEAALKPKLQKAFDEIRRLEALMSTWRPDSEISLINKGAGKLAVKVGVESFSVIEKSIWIGDKSEGVFDITFDAMHGLWHFDNGGESTVPSASDIEAKRKWIDYRKIVVDKENHTVKLADSNMRMNLGGIAKGYAVDAASEVLRKEGLTSFFVQAGGDLYVEGRKPDGSAYRVGVRDPRGRGATDFFAMLEVEDHAFSTAGDYERAFINNGKRYHHIIDPRTGYPATESRSVTVWAKDALIADAVDDAVFILGPEKGLALVESIPECGAVIVDKNNKVHISKRLTGLVQVLRPPTGGI